MPPSPHRSVLRRAARAAASPSSTVASGSIATDEEKRQGMVDEVAKMLQDEVAYVPMYLQPLVAASKDSVRLTQRPDDFFIHRWVEVGS